ncbi:MAG: hypothetical protein WD794_08720 [Mycobacteriales bacterium]
MPEYDELADRLAALDRMPSGPLPGAAAARARGAQRARRSRAVLALTGALVLALAVTAGAALTGGADRVVPPVGDPGPGEKEGLSASLLDPEDVAQIRGGNWRLRATYDLPFDPLPAGCFDGPAVFGSPAETALRFLDGPPPETFAHSLKAYSNGAEAQDAFRRVISSIESCGESMPAYQLQPGVPGSGPSRRYGTSRQGDDTVVFAIERIGAVLSGVAIRSFELDGIPPLADAAAAEVAGGPFAAPEPAAADDPTAVGAAGLLRAQDLAAAGLGAWSVDELTDPEGGLTECMRAATTGLPQGYPDVGGWARLVRDADGALVQQSTVRHPDDAEAARQLAAHVEAIRACPEEEILDWPAEPRVVLSVATHEVVEQSPDLVLVRTTYACESCGGRASYLAVMRTGPWLTVLNLPVADDADPAALARGVMGAANARLRATR